MYNPHIQSHHPESSPQGLALNLEVTPMTETEFLHLQRMVISDAILFVFLCAESSQHTRALVTRNGAIFSENSLFVFFDGANAITDGLRTQIFN